MVSLQVKVCSSMFEIGQRDSLESYHIDLRGTRAKEQLNVRRDDLEGQEMQIWKK